MAKTISFKRSGTSLEWTSGNLTAAYDVAKANDVLRETAMYHGFKQKIGDAAAIGRDKSNGKSATVADKFDAMHRVITALLANDWRAERADSVTELAEAVAEYKKITVEKATAGLKSKTDQERKQLRVHPPIKKILDRRAADAVKASGLDGDKILADF